ncbi:MAG: cytochrome c oxidase subunit II [Alphaproteobacteria bacterium]|nr:cytochrome c oxidase subunit II [Alphaproteobacteria bacterium]
MMYYIFIFLMGIQSAIASAPKPWQMYFQPSASPVMDAIESMHSLLLIMITGIAVVVSTILGYIVFRFRASRNPIPSRTSHNVLLEIAWTLVPVCLLAIIFVPTVKLLFFLDKAQNPEMTIKVIGRQWYWTYEYINDDPKKCFSFDSYMIQDKDLKPGQLRLLEVDKRLVIPVNTTVRVIVTSTDVIHSFAVPALGVKKDAVPGRINETWFKIVKEGVYYGQCSELCGAGHGFMPIALEVVSKDQYDQWLNKQEKEIPK